MKILIFDINYFPELTGVGKYTGEMSTWLSKQGHQVRVITGMPYYPEWQIHPEYKNKKWFTEIIDNVVVNRCPLYVPKKLTALKRILHEFSFIISSLYYWISIFSTQRYDVVICVAPPFHVGFLPALYSLIRKVPLWTHLQDLQIDMAKELGMLTNKYFLQLMFKIEKFILKQSTSVSTISEGMLQKTLEKQISQTSCELFPNWVDEKYIKPMAINQSLRSEFGLANTDKVILYAGSLGVKQGLELILDVAQSLIDRNDVKFLIIGSGGCKLELETSAHERHLTNILFYPLQPYEKLSALLATADVHLVLQKKSVSDLVLPSKLTSILAVGGCPIVAAEPGTNLYEIINQNNMGILIEPESADALLAGIEFAVQSDLSTYRQNARRYAQTHLSKKSILSKFERDLLKMLVKPTKPVRWPRTRNVPYQDSTSV